jgi:hypothetical protein
MSDQPVNPLFSLQLRMRNEKGRGLWIVRRRVRRLLHMSVQLQHPEQGCQIFLATIYLNG